MVNQISVAGLKLSQVTTTEFIEEVKLALHEDSEKLFITTPNSEFLHAGLKDEEVMSLLSKADLAIPDGIGIFWAERFLSLPLSFQSKLLKTLQALWQVVITGAKILLQPKLHLNLLYVVCSSYPL